MVRRSDETSNALDLEDGVFKKGSPRQIALSLKRSAESSARPEEQSVSIGYVDAALFLQPAGKTLKAKQKRLLDEAKDERRKALGRE